MIYICWVGLLGALGFIAMAIWEGDLALGLLAGVVGCFCLSILNEVMLEGEGEDEDE